MEFALDDEGDEDDDEADAGDDPRRRELQFDALRFFSAAHLSFSVSLTKMGVEVFFFKICLLSLKGRYVCGFFFFFS